MHQCIKFILFWNDTLHVSDGLSAHLQQFKTVHTATDICQTDTANCLGASSRQYLLDGTPWNSISFPLASNQQYLFDICLLLYVQS